MTEQQLDAIFSKLVVTYGGRFAAQYGTASPASIRADWLHELRDVDARAIEHALGHLPVHPPNVVQFREITRTVPQLVERRKVERREPTPIPPEVKERLAQWRKGRKA